LNDFGSDATLKYLKQQISLIVMAKDCFIKFKFQLNLNLIYKID